MMRALGVGLSFLLWAAPAWPQVEVSTGADGRLHMFNTSSLGGRMLSAITPRADLLGLIDRFAAVEGLDPTLVRAVIQVESGFNPRARSRKGAMGLMQLMPETARHLSVWDPYDPAENIRGGTRYLRSLLDRFDKRLDLALAGYNAGPEAVRKYGGVPPYRETRSYVENVIRLYRGNTGFSLSPPGAAGLGRQTYIRRDALGRIHMTTDPAP